MTATTSLSVFHQWLLAGPAGQVSACAIMLHCDDSLPCTHLIRDIADYLNEYDDEGDGRWLPATPDLVEKIVLDERHRRLLGMRRTGAGKAGDPQAEYRETLAGLGRRGHVVFRWPGVADEAPDLANAFHAGIGPPHKIPGECHLILNSELMDQKCIAHIIGDVFLEWLHRAMHRGTQLHEIR